MNAEPILKRIAAALHESGLEVVLIGNAAAALHGAPVTTIDFDFMFRKTPANMEKLKHLADLLRGCILRPYYPLSGMHRLTVDDEGLQLDFLTVVHGVKSFASLRSRATRVEFGKHSLLVADLKDVIRSKKGLGRPRTRRLLVCWKKPSVKKNALRRRRLSALRQEDERAEQDQIRRLLALPMNRRTHFLRVRLPNRGSAL